MPNIVLTSTHTIGIQPENGEPRVLPIIQSTTFKYDSSAEMAKLFDLEENGYFYTRLANPTNDAVAKKIADLEGGVGRYSLFRSSRVILFDIQHLFGGIISSHLQRYTAEPSISSR